MCCSTAGPTCCARVRATTPRMKSPTTMPRTPPCGFCNAVILPILTAWRISAGIWPLTNEVQSAVMPDGPPAAPRRADRKFAVLFQIYLNLWNVVDDGRGGELPWEPVVASLDLATHSTFGDSQARWGRPPPIWTKSKALSARFSTEPPCCVRRPREASQRPCENKLIPAFGDRTATKFVEKHSGQEQESFQDRVTRNSSLAACFNATPIAERYAPRKNFGGDFITEALNLNR